MTTIGSVEFKVDFDGKTLPQQAKRIGEQAGVNLSRGMEQSFNREQGAFANRLEQSLNVTGKKAGLEFTNALEGILRSRRSNIANTLAGMLGDRTVFDAFVKNSASVQEGLDRVTASLEKARDAGIINNEQFRSMNLTFKNWGGTLLENERQLSANVNANERYAASIEGVNRKVKDYDTHARHADSTNRRLFGNASKGLGNLDGETKLIIALVLAAANDIAVLGSAAGAAITTLGFALGAAALAAGVFAIGLNGVTGELSKIDPAARPAIKAFRALGDDFRSLQQAVQGQLFAGLKDEIDALAVNFIPALQTGLVGIAGVLNGALARVMTELASPEGIAVVTQLLAGAAPIIASLTNAAITFVAAIGNIGVIALPYVQLFSDKLNELVIQFNEWITSVAGQTSITEWFDNMVIVMGAVLPLLGSIGDLFAGLVTPETVANLVTTLGDLQGFMPALQTLLSAIGAVDPIGLIAQALNQLGQAMAPAAPALMEMAHLIGDLLSNAISAAAPLVGNLIEAFIPLVNILLSTLGPAILGLITGLTPLTDLFTQVAVLVTPLIELLGGLLAEALTTLTPIFGVIAEVVGELIAGILPPLMTIIEALAPIFMTLVEAILPLIEAVLPPLALLITTLVEALAPLIVSVLGLITPFLDLLTPLIQLIGPILGPLIELLVQLVSFAIEPLINMIDVFLVPAFTLVADVISAVLPIIEGLMQTLGGLIDFIMGVFTGDWDRAWDGLKDIAAGQLNAIIGIAEGVINSVIAIINNMIGQINGVAKTIGIDVKVAKIGKVDLPNVAFAAGGLVSTATRAVVGEAGPEAVVPLHRPLGQVDPSVRGISALLQGKEVPGSAGGSGGGWTVEAGAITISGVRDERNAAGATMDRLVALTSR